MSIIRVDILESSFLGKFNVWEVSLNGSSLFSFLYPLNQKVDSDELESIIVGGLDGSGFFPVPFNFSPSNIVFSEDGGEESCLKITHDGDVFVETGSKKTNLDPSKLLKEVSEEVSEKAMELLSEVTDLTAEEAKDFVFKIRENASSIKRITEIFIEYEPRFSEKCDSEKCFKAMVEAYGNYPIEYLEDKLISRASGVEKIGFLEL